MSNSNTTPTTTFAGQVGRIAIETFNIAKINELLIDEVYGLLLLRRLNRAGLRLVLVTDHDIAPDEVTVELPALHAPMDASERTDTLPCFLRPQAG